MNFLSDNIIQYKKSLFYTASLYNNLVFHNNDPTDVPWWNKITDYPSDNIILGAIPLANYGHLEKLYDTENVRYVLTMLEPFEYETDTWFTEPVKPADWKKKGVVQKIIATSDFNPVSQENIKLGVEFIETCLEKGNGSIYIHCKAGKSRSQTAVLCYLMKNCGMSFDSAINYVKSKRPVVSLNAGQRLAVLEYYENLQKESIIKINKFYL